MANWFAGEPKEQLAGKTAVVMGGGSGIGKATAQALCAAGANVMVCGVPEQICLDTAEELKAEGGKAIGMFCDGTKQSDIDAMLTKTVEEFGGIDMVVSTAGISLPRTNALDVTEEMWEKIFAVNVKANWFIATSAAKYMKDKGVIIMHHADSFMEPIVEDMVELGIDIWQGVLPQNDIPQTAEAAGWPYGSDGRN